ncbi:MAG: DUF1365 domain-containing protein [Alphaproteobacteria bacterium]|nr:DUF1365 domain-containing protein [Alphaproteobacteria bacterium]
MSAAPRSCLYFGTVMHQRLRPRRHRLNYRVFTLYVDLDELPALHRRLRFFSHNRFNLLALHDADHGDGAQAPAAWVRQQLATAGIDTRGGRIGLLCYPRLLGYAFNPISVYFCFDSCDALAAVLYEVHNTFGERHSYLMRVEPGAPEPVRHRCAKRFHVSPFIAMEATYHFRLRPPGERLSIAIAETDAGGPLLHAATTGERTPLTDARLVAALLRYPLMTVKVIAGIHWEALKLWLKGVAVHRKPAPPATPVTIVPAGGPAEREGR